MVTVELTLRELQYLHRKTAADALIYLQHAVAGNLCPDRLRVKDFIVALSDKLAAAQPEKAEAA